MPYMLVGNCVHKQNADKSAGDVIAGGCHDTHEQALSHMRALYANVSKEQSMSEPNKIDQFTDWFTGMFSTTKAVGGTPDVGMAHGPGGVASSPALSGKKKKPVDPNEKDENPKEEASETAAEEDAENAAEKKPPMKKVATKDFAADFSVFKQTDGTYRWIGVTSSGFRDRDKQLVTSDALKADVARMNKENAFGNLSFWHVMFKEVNPPLLDPGIALDIASCDVSEMAGEVSNLESGVFFDNEIGAAFEAKQKEMGFSREFFYPASEPDAQGNYNRIYTFRRTILPKQFASNLMSDTTLSIHKETPEGKMSSFASIVGEEKAKATVKAIKDKEQALASIGVERKEVAGVDIDAIAAKVKETMPAPMTEAQVKSIVEASVKEAFTLFVTDFTSAVQKQQSAQAQKEETLAATVKELTGKVTELYGDAPNMLKGARPSESASNVMSEAKAKEFEAKTKALSGKIDTNEPMAELTAFMFKGNGAG